MASNSQLTEAERNFTRFFFLNFKVSPDIVRRFFDGVFPPAQLAQTINSGMNQIINLKNTKRINAAQFEILRNVRGTVWPPYLPPIPIGTTPTSSKDFDLTLMICLLRNLGGLLTPSNGWDQLPLPNDTLPGADLATLKWYRNQVAHTTVTSMDTNEFNDKWTRVDKALTSLNKGQTPHEVTEILNYDLDGEQAKTLANAELKLLKKEYLECEKAKKQIESVLSICEKEKEQIESDLSHHKEGNLPKNIADANASLVETWLKDDKSFYDTKASCFVHDKVQEFACILVTSSSGLGKTAIIRHIALKLQSEGFEIVSVEYPEDVIKYKTIKKQVFLIDDVLGKYDLNPNLLEQWERVNEKLISCLGKDEGSHKLLCTLRSQIVVNKRFENGSTILNKEVIDLEHESYTLSEEEKQKILMKHLETNNLEREIKTEEVKKMCKTNYAFPLLCKLVSNDEERFRNRIEFFRQPLSLFREELYKISSENKKLYCILVICMLHNGFLNKSIFNIDHDKIINRVMQTCGLQTNMSMKELEDSAVSAVGSYFTENSTNFRFMHDALEETVGYHFYKFNPRVMFSYCDILFIRDRVRIHSNEHKNENVDENIVIIREDELNKYDLQPLYNRLWDELTSGRFSNLLMSNIFKNERFVCIFETKFENNNQNIFLNTISTERRKGSDQSVLKKILKILSNDELQDKKDAISRVIDAIADRSTLMHWIVAFGCNELFQYAWSKMTTLDRNWILDRDYIFPPSVKSFFPLAVLGGSLDIVTQLISSGADVNCFSEFLETPLHIAVKSGLYDMARLLVSNGAKVNLRGWFTMNVPITVTSNKDELISLILEYDLNQTNLHKAVRDNDLGHLRSNIRSDNIDSKTKSGWTVLHYAVLLNQLEAVYVLFHERLPHNNEHCLNFTQDEERDMLCSEPIPNVGIVDNNGLTAVHLAVINNNFEILSLLLRNKAEVKVRDVFDRTPLHYITSESTTKLLLTHCSRNKCLETNRNAEEGSEYEIPPMSALKAMCFNITLKSAFRKVCRDFINMPDREGNTPLHCVIKRLLKEESSDCIDTLLENGANPYLFNDSDTLALEFIESSSDTVKYINNSAKYRQSLERTYKILALIMFLLIVVTGCITSVIGKAIQNASIRCYEYFLLDQDLQATESITELIYDSIFLWLISITFYIRSSDLPLRCLFSVFVLLILRCVSFIFVVSSEYARIFSEFSMLMIFNIMVYSLFVIITSDSLNFTSLSLVNSILGNTFFFLHLFCHTFFIFIMLSLSVKTIYEIIMIDDPQNILKKTTSNCTECSSVNISSKSLPYNIIYKNETDFPVQYRTDPNITSYNGTHGTITLESGVMICSILGLMSLFWFILLLHATCAYCFMHCACKLARNKQLLLVINGFGMVILYCDIFYLVIIN